IWEKTGWLSEGYTEKLAVAIRAERIRTIRHGEELPQQKKKVPRFDDVWERYRAWAEQNKTRGARDDISRYKKYLKDPLAEKRLSEISTFDLEKLKASLLKRPVHNGGGRTLSPATVKHCLVLVRQVFNKAFAWRLYQGPNPIQGVKMPVLQNRRDRFLNHEEAATLLQALRSMRIPHLHDMALLSLHTGLRAGEIFNLRGYDLDFDNGIIRVSDPKNRTTRHAYMTHAVKDMLMRRVPESSNELVFFGANEGKIKEVSKSFSRIINSLDFNKGITDRRQRVSFHTLRHTFASWLALQGESIITLKEMLGHKSTAMTERYSHLVPNHKRKAVARLEEIFNGHEEATGQEVER
ncbi:MAG: hypothetical protein A2Y65_01250, partial [Deltaproteobacteria bacterium RBG_13_52_11]